jgi:oxygen-dependent protoporphyrinogen oxidase
VREELADMLGGRGEPDFVRVQRWPRSMPQYHLGHVQRTEAIAARTAAHPGLALAGSAYEGVGLPDSFASGDRAARAVAESRAKR